MSSAINPFKIAVSDTVLTDLKQRLQAARWPEDELVSDWSQGVPNAWLREICAYWADGYDWRKREESLNRFAQFTTELDGLEIHFIHQRSPHADARPLILTHGWPGSVVEFHKVIEPLVDPTAFGGDVSDAFHVVCPALPGYGFSAKPRSTGWGVERIARAWSSLMLRLGYPSYFAQGGDWGSAVTQAIGWQDPEHCQGIHVTMAMSTRPQVDGEPSAEEKRALDGMKEYRRWDSGYSKQQATRPQTLGYGLTDSPIGQAAWILEKFWAWTDCAGHPENVLSRDELLDNVMFYWATASATSSARLYWQSFGAVERHTITVPTGVAVYPKEIVPPVRAWMEAGDYPNIQHWTEQPKGGHFAAFEQPQLFVDDVRAWARPLRNL
ncbi:MAG: epoxide hydrolase [Chromatiales bacterium]|jgi:epoxide hydrolase|nr:epoxide hydrolase [Chromatiales bacterium]